MRSFARAARRRLRRQNEQRSLARVDSIHCDCANLTRLINAKTLSQIFHSPDLSGEWVGTAERIEPLQITDTAGGVNRGDRRALWYLIRYFRPEGVLEIGTHIGASTVHLAAALPNDGRIVTVDIEDVNNEMAKPWTRYGATASPAELAGRLNLHVEFVTSNSLAYLSSCEPASFDFVFLDGDHAAATVYQEIPAACRVLRRGGVIVLHDFFPGLMPLWSNRVASIQWGEQDTHRATN